jgi:alpha-beta hydrolase superfamily lysophospholipase
MRKDIEFRTEDGVTLCGWHFVPDGRQGKVPTIVMAHGFSAVKEMYLDRFANAFAAAGLASVVFDHRNFGASGGAPRQEIDPWRQATRSPTPKRCKKPTQRASASGERATAAAMCSWWVRSIAE